MRVWMLGVALAALAALVAGGCSDDSKPSDMRRRQDAAMKDPFNYSPYEDSNKVNVSGGGISDFDRKAFKRDVNSVLSP